jgi:hypothetical protein
MANLLIRRALRTARRAHMLFSQVTRVRPGADARITLDTTIFVRETSLEKGHDAPTKASHRTGATARQLDKLIEEAIIDCYNEEEQVIGFFTIPVTRTSRKIDRCSPMPD